MSGDLKTAPAPRCRPLALWPLPDRNAWDAAMVKGDILEPGGDGAHWAPHSRRKIAKGYGRWLDWLDTQRLLAPDLGPAARITPERVVGYVAGLQLSNSPYTVLARVQAIRVMAPQADWTWLRRIESKLRHRVVSVRNKRSRIVPVGDLAAFGIELMTRADRPESDTPLRRACQFRDGLMIALLAARPLRRRNFTRIEIGRHLVRISDTFTLQFDGAETKTGEPINAPIPLPLIPYLERYLSEYRPHLLGRNGRWKRQTTTAGRPDTALWISAHGSAMTEMAAYDNICGLTRARFGHAVNPHLFRDSAATSIAIEDPEHVYIVRSILGHSTMQSGERHYIHAQTLPASRRYQQEILKLRAGYRRGSREPVER
jgi:integrase/recombinase XerD